MDIIFIEKLEVETIIGVYEFERTQKQPLVLDIEMTCETQQAIASDNLKYALDYHQICKDVHAFVSQTSFQLIETLAEAITQKILENKAVMSVSLVLSKPKALDLAQNVGIKIIRKST